ncbi:unnamed protein product [Urochloa humidicola]
MNSGESGREKRPLDMERSISVSRAMRSAELSSLHRLLNSTSDTMMRCLYLSSSGYSAASSPAAARFGGTGPAPAANLADGTRSTKMSRRSLPLPAASSRPSSAPKTMRALEGYLRPSEASLASTRARQSGQLALDSTQRLTQARWKAWRHRGRRRRWSASSTPRWPYLPLSLSLSLSSPRMPAGGGGGLARAATQEELRAQAKLSARLDAPSEPGARGLQQWTASREGAHPAPRAHGAHTIFPSVAGLPQI